MSFPSNGTPFNPPGTFPPGSFPPGFFAPGSPTPVQSPSYPLRQSSSPAPPYAPNYDFTTPFSSMPPQDHKYYPQASSLPPAHVAHSHSASTSIGTNWNLPLASTGVSTIAPQYVTVAENPITTTMHPAHTTFPPHAITTLTRHSSVPVGYIGVDPETLSHLARSATMHSQSLPSPAGTSTHLDQSSNSYQSFYPPSPHSPLTPKSHNAVADIQQFAYLPQQQSDGSKLASPISIKNEKMGGTLPSPPKSSLTSGGNIVSKDQLLNTSGDALYRFILDNMGPPNFRLHCYGSHIVTDTQVVHHGSGNRLVTTTKTVLDFDFTIDLSLSLQHTTPGQHYVLSDDTPAYRGKMYKQVSQPECTFRSLQDCARNYAESPKTGKEFRFRKVVTGLNASKIVDAVNQIINSTGHTGAKRVYFTVPNSVIKVHPDTALMTMITDKAIKVLLCIVLVWPFIWLYRRFGSQGGKWDVCRAAYVFDRDPRDSDSGGSGVRLGDGDWVKIWERTLRLAVGNRIQSQSPIYRPTKDDTGVILFD